MFGGAGEKGLFAINRFSVAPPGRLRTLRRIFDAFGIAKLGNDEGFTSLTLRLDRLGDETTTNDTNLTN